MTAVRSARMGGERSNGVDHLQVQTSRGEDRVVIELHGELDLAGAPLLAGCLQEDAVSGARALVLDLGGLQFVDSAGLRTILTAHAGARERGQLFALTRGTPQVERLLAIAGVEGRLPRIESAADAIPAPPAGS